MCVARSLEGQAAAPLQPSPPPPAPPATARCTAPPPRRWRSCPGSLCHRGSLAPGRAWDYRDWRGSRRSSPSRSQPRAASAPPPAPAAAPPRSTSLLFTPEIANAARQQRGNDNCSPVAAAPLWFPANFRACLPKLALLWLLRPLAHPDGVLGARGRSPAAPRGGGRPARHRHGVLPHAVHAALRPDHRRVEQGARRQRLVLCGVGRRGHVSRARGSGVGRRRRTSGVTTSTHSEAAQPVPQRLGLGSTHAAPAALPPCQARVELRVEVAAKP